MLTRRRVCVCSGGATLATRNSCIKAQNHLNYYLYCVRQSHKVHHPQATPTFAKKILESSFGDFHRKNWPFIASHGFQSFHDSIPLRKRDKNWWPKIGILGHQKSALKFCEQQRLATCRFLLLHISGCQVSQTFIFFFLFVYLVRLGYIFFFGQPNQTQPKRINKPRGKKIKSPSN